MSASIKEALAALASIAPTPAFGELRPAECESFTKAIITIRLALKAAAQEAEAQPAPSAWPTEDECQFLIARFAERVFGSRQWLTRDDFTPGMGTRDYLMSLLLELRDTRGKNLCRAELAK